MSWFTYVVTFAFACHFIYGAWAMLSGALEHMRGQR